ncbi:MAG TPA: BamA/TamA family outer membrane protein [Polyangia bacterium]|jgi:hypothetical protein
MRPLAHLAALVAVLLGAPPAAQAVDLRAQYEERLVEWALAQAHLERDPAPAGKTIERIAIVRENVIARSDPWPQFFNWVHVKTRDHVVRRELLVAPGETWDEDRIQESARNLRRGVTFAVVRVVAARGSRPGRVVLLVVTKDLWSIRLNTAFSQVGSVVQVLDFQPAEENFLGRAKSVSLHVRLQQLDLGDSVRVRDKLALGQGYVDPRLVGTRLQLSEAVDFLVAGDVPCGGQTNGGRRWCPTRHPGQLDGFAAAVDLTRPLFSLATEWAFDVNATANVRQVRRFVFNSSGAPVPPGQESGLSLDTVSLDPAAVPAALRQYVPRVYDMMEIASEASVTRSFGRAFKHDVTGGLGAYRYQYTPPAGFPFDEVTRQRYVALSLPRSEDAAYLLLGYRDRATRYVRLRNIESFALTEDYLLGHDASLTAQLAANPGQATQSFAGAVLKSQYRWYRADDLLTVWLNAQTRWQPGLPDIGRAGPFANTTLDTGVRNVSPRFWVGRLHAQVRTILRDNHLDRATSTLGGDTGLRGYPSAAFEGGSLFQVNAEYRTNPVNFYTLHLGLVGFYDGGAVFGADPRNPEQTLAFNYFQSVGAGLRAVFPQFDKYALRADLGVPLSAQRGSFGTWFSFSFGQVF